MYKYFIKTSCWNISVYSWIPLLCNILKKTLSWINKDLSKQLCNHLPDQLALVRQMTLRVFGQFLHDFQGWLDKAHIAWIGLPLNVSWSVRSPAMMRSWWALQCAVGGQSIYLYNPWYKSKYSAGSIKYFTFYPLIIY